MYATKGDRITIKAHHVGEHPRDGLVVEVHGEHGQPPYVVQWEDHEGVVIFYPGPDAVIEHFHDKESVS